MIPIYSSAQMKEAEKNNYPQCLFPVRELIRRAAAAMEPHIPHGKTLVLCGKGNNGGDGYALAALLRKKQPCDVLFLEDPASDDVKFHMVSALKSGVMCIYGNGNYDFSSYDIIIDALYGIGFRGCFTPEYQSLAQAVNSSGKTVVSLDMPSGLNADNGIACPDCVRADLVLAVSCLKYGLLLNSGKDYCKKYILSDIGIPSPYPSYVAEATDFSSFVQPRINDVHKGNFGYITLFGGSENYVGAIKLANLSASAMRSGSGVVRLAVPRGLFSAVSPHLLESTLFDENDLSHTLSKVAAVGVGCGWGRSPDRVLLLKRILEAADCPTVVDADGLYAIKPLLPDIRGKKIVVTPHYAEMAYLTDKPIAEIRSDSVSVATEFAKKYGIIVALKGASTVVTDGTTVFVSSTGCAGMATAGSGDVLTGIITSVLGQSQKNFLLSVAYATYLNGLSGQFAQEKFTDIGMIASDTVGQIRQALLFIRKMNAID